MFLIGFFGFWIDVLNVVILDDLYITVVIDELYIVIVDDLYIFIVLVLFEFDK